MRVFVAGATGAVGRYLIPMLVKEGHQVTGLSRSREKADGLRRMGAAGVVADALERSAVLTAVQEARPDAVIHQLTAIPAKLDPLRRAEDFALTNRLRTEGIDYLLEAARVSGAKRFLAQSFGGYMWAREPGPPMSEEEGRDPESITGVVAALAHVERAVPEAGGVVLRYGSFYGPGTGLSEGGATVAQIRAHEFPIVGKGAGVRSFVHVEDAARAAVAALDRGAPGIYNIADDEPAAVAEWLPYLAEVLGAKAPRRVPEQVERPVTWRGISNAKAKRELGWTPMWGSWREGFREAL